MKKLQSLFLMLFLFIGISLNAVEPGVQVGIMTTGANNQIFVINGDSAIKAGTSSKNGDMFITLPANVNELTFYIAAWNKGAGNVIVTDTATTDTIAVLDILACSTIAGSGNTFTIDDVEPYLNTLQLTPQDSELVLKFESGTAIRFVVWNPEYKVEDNGGVTSGVSDLKVNNNVIKYIDNYGKLYIKYENDVYSIYGSKIK